MIGSEQGQEGRKAKENVREGEELIRQKEGKQEGEK